MIRWSERPEMYEGKPSIVLVAECGDVCLHGRYYPKDVRAAVKRSAFVGFAERVFGEQWNPPLDWGDTWVVKICTSVKGMNVVDPAHRDVFEIE